MTTPLITAPGAYENVAADDYHGNINLLPEPSLSSSGAKKIIAQSPYHFWYDSPLNPDRPEQEDKPHFSLGRLAHDLVLTPEEVENGYHFLPEGFKSNATKQFAVEIELAEHARGQGRTIVRHQDAVKAQEIANAISRNSDALAALSLGVPELTIAYKDKETGVWLRVRPDWTPYSVINGADVMVVSDLKFMAQTHCRPHGFSKAIHDFGYHQSVAFYEDGIEAIYGRRPTNWLFIVVEKDAPYTVSVYELPREDIERGRFQNRIAINRFAECLQRGIWPDYTSEQIEQVGLPFWARKAIDEHGSVNQAALVNSASGV
jgi:hypothetical protein